MDPIFSKAYAVYCLEARKDLAALSGVIAQFTSELSAGLPLDAAQAKRLELLKAGKLHSHKIKGGAGIFGLEEILAQATLLEQLYDDALLVKKAQGLDKIRDVTSLLAQMIEELPLPQ